MKNKTKNKIRSTLNVPLLGNFVNRRIFNAFEKVIAFSMIISLVMLWSYIPIKPAKAAGIDTVTTTLVTSEAVSTESQITVVFSPTTAITTGDTITIYLGEVSGGDPWVDTDATVDNTDITCAQSGTTFDTYVQTDATASVPLLVSCNVASGGDTSALTVTIGTDGTDSLYNPAGADGYSVAIVTNDDSGAGVVYVGDGNDVTVSATVLPNLTLTVGTADGTYCTTTSGVTSCALGTVLTTTTPSGNYDVDVGTNATSGATVSLAEDGNLRNGANDINDVGDGTVTAGSEEYGVVLTETGTAWTIDPTYAATEAPVITGPDVAATSSGPVDTSTDNIDASHKVAAASSTLALTYSHIVTWTASANF